MNEIHSIKDNTITPTAENGFYITQAGESDSYSKAKRASWVGVIGNILLFVIKLIGGILSHSMALISDAIHSFSDIISSLIVLIGLRIAAAPPDKKHPYGHGKAESLAAGIIGLLLILMAILIAWHSVSKLYNSEVIQAKTISKNALWIVLFSILVKELLFQYKYRIGIKLQSLSLIADAWHHRSDAFSSLAALFGIAGAIVGGPHWYFLDDTAALVIAVIIGWVGLRIMLKIQRELMDSTVSRTEIEYIKKIAISIDDVLGVEKIYARKSGLDILTEIHVEVDPTMPVEKAHKVAQFVRDSVIKQSDKVKRVTVHIEPFYPDDH